MHAHLQKVRVLSEREDRQIHACTLLKVSVLSEIEGRHIHACTITAKMGLGISIFLFFCIHQYLFIPNRNLPMGNLSDFPSSH